MVSSRESYLESDLQKVSSSMVDGVTYVFSHASFLLHVLEKLIYAMQMERGLCWAKEYK